jgi:hypothetical protein
VHGGQTFRHFLNARIFGIFDHNCLKTLLWE